MTTAKPIERVLAVARRAGVPVIFGAKPDYARREATGQHVGPHLDTWLDWRHGRAVVLCQRSRREMACDPAFWRIRSDVEEAAKLIHEIAHAFVWSLTGVDPKRQDEWAGYLVVERAMFRAAGLSDRFWRREARTRGVGDGREWRHLSANEKRAAHRCAALAAASERWAVAT